MQNWILRINCPFWRHFLEKSSAFAIPISEDPNCLIVPLNVLAYEQEKQSLLELYDTIILSHEILFLWQILIEHQFHVILALLPPPIIEQLMSYTLLDLVHKYDTVSRFFLKPCLEMLMQFFHSCLCVCVYTFHVILVKMRLYVI
jgi:hypothetical protein